MLVLSSERFYTDVSTDTEELTNKGAADIDIKFTNYFPEVFALADRKTEEEVDIPNFCEFTKAQKMNHECHRSAEAVGKPNSTFLYDAVGLLIRVSTINRASQRSVPANLPPRILRLCHYSLLAGNPGERQVYDSMRREFHWSHMANDACSTVRDCQSCAKNRHTNNRQRKMCLFSLAGPPEFVAIDLLGPLPKTKADNQYIIVKTDRFSKLTN